MEAPHCSRTLVSCGWRFEPGRPCPSGISASNRTRPAVGCFSLTSRRSLVRAQHRPSGQEGPPLTATILHDQLGFMAFSHPIAVYADACHREDGYHPGPVDTLNGLVTVLIEQHGWAEVTAPSDISIDGYVGKAFRRTAPADMSDCATRGTRTRVMAPSEPPGTYPDFRSWDSPDHWARGTTSRARLRPCGSSTSVARSSSSKRERGRSHRRGPTPISPPTCSARSASRGSSPGLQRGTGEGLGRPSTAPICRSAWCGCALTQAEQPWSTLGARRAASLRRRTGRARPGGHFVWCGKLSMCPNEMVPLQIALAIGHRPYRFDRRGRSGGAAGVRCGATRGAVRSGDSDEVERREWPTWEVLECATGVE